MSKRKQTDGTTTIGELAILASSVGLVEKSDDGRQAFSAWWANDPKAARKALFSRVAARRVAASGIRSITAAERQAAATGQPIEHGMRVPRSIGASVLRGARRATGQTSPGARISEAND